MRHDGAALTRAQKCSEDPPQHFLLIRSEQVCRHGETLESRGKRNAGSRLVQVPAVS
jgi:hypothetical protein